MKYKKKKRGDNNPFVRAMISNIIVIMPNNSRGLDENKFEADFDLFFILIYIAKKIMRSASK